MAYTYDRTVTAVTKTQVKALKGSRDKIVEVLQSMDKHLTDGMEEADAARALGVLATAERLTEGLRERLENMPKAK